MERRRDLPEEDGEVVAGYGALGLPFESGHVLAFRRVVATSLGPPSVSVWHRDPEGRWTFYVNVEPSRSCARFFGAAVDEVVVTDIAMGWTGPHTLSLSIPHHRMHWGLRIWATPFTRALNAGLGVLPEATWRSPTALRLLGPPSGWLLGVGGMELTGRLPSRQSYRMRPHSIWRVEGSAAVVGGRELGRTTRLDEQPHIGGVPVANGGVFAFGDAVQEPFDPSRHVGLTEGGGRVRREGG
jgi:hypothetical protein